MYKERFFFENCKCMCLLVNIVVVVVVVKTRGHLNDEKNKRIPNLFISSVGARQSLVEFESGVELFGAPHKAIRTRISKISKRFQYCLCYFRA